jgi:hypothetical protein
MKLAFTRILPALACLAAAVFGLIILIQRASAESPHPVLILGAALFLVGLWGVVVFLDLMFDRSKNPASKK